MERPWAVVVLLTLLAALVVLPVLLGAPSHIDHGDVRTLTIVTPHNEQIRTEFGRAFEQWHADVHGEPVAVAWSVPGGTSEIRALLESQWIASLERGDRPGGFADLVFGGGSYEHSNLARGVTIRRTNLSASDARQLLAGQVDAVDDLLDAARANGTARGERGHTWATVTPTADGRFDVEVGASVSQPAGIETATLADRYGRETIGGVPLWESEGHWYGTALSSFGLIANLDELQRLGISAPTSWRALADPRLQGGVSLVNPAQSGSVTTAFETLLGRLGWEHGWQVLRRAAANSRTISASALRGPMDVAAGDAAMGVCIDFFGRGESQALADHGAPDRIRYIDPVGETTIDPDPISMLADPPDPELARRFIEFTLTDEAQGLWQLPPGAEGGPTTFSLRRIPITQSAWARDGDRYLDRDAQPGDIDPPQHAHRATRAFIAPLLSAMALDEREALASAWNTIVLHPAYPDTAAVVTADDVTDPQLKAMLQAFDAMPLVPAPDGEVMSMDTQDNRSAIKAGWLRGGWRDDGLWNDQQRGSDAFRQRTGAFFRGQYQSIIDGSAGSAH